MPNVKGTLDYQPKEWSKIQNITETIRKRAQALDIEEIDTPIIETQRLLLGKYGEEAETKLIFNLEQQKEDEDSAEDKEQEQEKERNKTALSLRYDLTVPFTRYLQDNGIEAMRRFQVGKVFRRDKPQIERARFREFYQADIDLVGEYDPVICEAEIFWLINRVLEDLEITNYLIRYNYRDNLYSMCNQIKVKTPKQQQLICTTIDKLDKLPWEEVAKELKELRGLDEEQIEQLNRLLSQNYLDPKISEFDQQLREVSQKITFDASLARGLDYYTGIIYEVTIEDSSLKTVIAGGRYDKLVYKTTRSGRRYIPAIGVSFGISRLQLVAKPMLEKRRRVAVISRDLKVKMRLLDYYRKQGFIVSYDRGNIKTIRQITYAVKNDYWLIAIYGEDGDKVKVKELFNKDEDRLYPLEDFTV